jgi:hypothetical protein
MLDRRRIRLWERGEPKEHFHNDVRSAAFFIYYI